MASEEVIVLDLVLDSLRAKGHAARVVRRPDQEERNSPAVDFEIEFNGALVAVEVMSASEFAVEFRQMERVGDALQQAVRSFVEIHGLGKIALHIGFREAPAHRKANALVDRLAAETRRAIVGLDLGQTFELAGPPAPLRRFAVTRMAAQPDFVGLIVSPAPAYWMEATVDSLIERIIERKAGQTKGYERAWVVVFARTPVIPADDFVDGIGRHRAALPNNWERVYFVEGRTTIEALIAV